MNIALIGATGFVGTAILKEALQRGDKITAIARHTEKLAPAENCIPVDLDISEEDRLADVLKGNDIVISAYNAGWTNPDLYTDFLAGSEIIEQAVRKSGVKRLLVVGGAGSLYVAPGIQLVDTPEFPAAFKPGSLAARDYLNKLKEVKDIDWTFISPAIEMHQGTSGERKGHYRTGLENPVFDEKGKSIISVEDLAVAIVDEAENEKHSRQRFTVAY